MRNRDDLRPGQKLAVDHVFERDEGYLVAECGAGKTAILFTAILDWIEEGVIDRAIVAAPPRVAREVWPYEPAKWAHLNGRVEVTDATGTPAQRKTSYRHWVAKGGILTVTIPNLTTIEKELRGIDLSRTALVIDEITGLKAPTGVTAKAAEALSERCAIAWGASATPRPNGYEDLFRPIRIVSRGKVWGGTGGFEQWQRERFMPLDRNGYNWRVHTFAAKEIERDIAPLMYRIQADAIAGLGDLRSGEGFDRVVTLPDEVMKQYKQMEKKLLAQVMANLKDATAEEVVFALSKAAGSAKLEQIAGGHLYDEGRAVATLHDRKIEALKELLDEIGPSENVIVAYKYKHDLAMIREALGDIPALGGGTSAAQGKAIMADWNARKLPLLAMHPASAGHGIELQGGGRRIIWYTPTWSGEMFHQANRRIYRSGQIGHCYVHQIIAKDTVDELKINRVAGRTAEQAEYIERIGLLK